MEQIDLPENFTVRNTVTCSEYRCHRIGNEVTAHHSHGTSTYRRDEVEGFLREVRWVIVNEANGFNARGKPLYFGRENVEYGMRVEFANGKMFVVVPNLHNTTKATEPMALCALTEPGWMDIDFTVRPGDNPWNIAKVYASSRVNSQYFTPPMKEELIWQRTDADKIAAAIARANELRTELAKAADQVVEWTERMERIKLELQAI